jgi:glycosyltransferase involved in cell wall biosynthesis
LDEKEKFKVMSECDVMLFPALVGAAIDPPLVILEAMALGKCVIASSIQSVPYILGNNRGIVISRQNLEEELYIALKKLVREPKLVKEYAYHSKQWVLREHNMQTVCDRMKNIIDV